MGNFRRDNNSRGGSHGGSGGRFFGGRNSGFGRSEDRGSRDDRPREMFKTVCSNCGKDCEVPFKPTTGKPVYCSDCFEKMGGRSERPERSDRPRFDGPRRDDRPQAPRVDYSEQFKNLSEKMDKIIALLTPKTEEKKSDSETSSGLKKVVKVKKEKIVKEDK
jgi:CxxC-x17-CxxC domain-containing protein